MKKISELGLEAIQLEDQVLLVEKSVISVGDYITDSLRVWRWNDDCSLLGRKKVISSTTPLEGLPLLVIEDEVKKLTEEAYKKHSVKDDTLSLNEQIQRTGGFNVGFKEGYNKAKETYRFTEEDLRKAIEYGFNYADPFKVGVEKLETDNSKFIQSLTKKELWIDAYWDCCGRCIDGEDKCTATWELNIENNQIKAVWK